MALNLIPISIQDSYEIHEWRHASAILQNDFPREWDDIIDVLDNFWLYKSHLIAAGGRKSNIANSFDDFLYRRGWEEKSFDTRKFIDGHEYLTPTHKVDCFKNRIALEIEWNNKTEFYDRDLNNFRLLFELGAISAGIIITRSTNLQQLFNHLGRGQSFGASTTHMNKLIPKIDGGSAGGCPILIFGITDRLYVEDV